jgi:hypothetical protein
MMIRDKNGNAVELDSIIEVEGEAYTVQDIDKGYLILTPVVGRKTRKRLSVSELGMTDDNPIDKKKAQQARAKLRSFWEE